MMRYFLTLTVILGLVALPASMAVAGLQATVTAENNGSPHPNIANSGQDYTIVSDGATDSYWGPPSATGYGGFGNAFADRWSFDMDLGSDAAVTGVRFWNYQGSTQNGISQFTLEYATQAEGAGNYNQSLTADTFGNQADTNASPSPGGLTGDAPGHGDIDALLDMPDKTFRYTRFTWDSNLGGNFVGMSEIQFEGTIVPEPSTLLLSLLGLTGLMAVWRRRNRG